MSWRLRHYPATIGRGQTVGAQNEGKLPERARLGAKFTLLGDEEYPGSIYTAPVHPATGAAHRAAGGDLKGGYVKRLLCLLILALLALPAPACAETWAIYFYLCGSDLESKHGVASRDLKEITETAMPSNVTFIVETGGAKKWKFPGVQHNKLQRWKIENGKMKLLESLPKASMAAKETLASFVKFCTQNYPADHQVLIMWDHGGGSALGMFNDELYGDASMSLKEMRETFASVFGAKPSKKPFDIVGFDACLMATFDTACAMEPFAKYLVASENTEPGNGWGYDHLFNAMRNKAPADAQECGRMLCDGFMDGCREYETDRDATLSLVDLSKISDLKVFYHMLGMEAVAYAVDHENFAQTYARLAKQAENYVNSKSEGYSNMVDMGTFYSQMKEHLPEFTDPFLEQLDRAVVYKVHGRSRNPSGLSCYYPYDTSRSKFNAMMESGVVTPFLLMAGLKLGYLNEETVIRRLEGIVEEISHYEKEQENPQEGAAAQPGTPAPQGPSGGQTPFVPQVPGIAPAPSSSHDGGVTAAAGSLGVLLGRAGSAGDGGVAAAAGAVGTLLARVAPEGGGASIERIATLLSGFSVKPTEILDMDKLEDFEVSVNDDGDAVLDLGADIAQKLESVHFRLCYYDEKKDIILYLGSDADMDADWEKGVFKDNFRNVWPALNGHLVFMEITEEGKHVNRYMVPILLNGKRCNLVVDYDFDKSAYEIIGVRPASEQNGVLVERALLQLKKGDRVQTLLQKTSIEKDDDFEEVPVDEFILGDKVNIKDEDMGDGKFMFLFEMTNLKQESATSQVVHFEVKNGKITTEVLD